MKRVGAVILAAAFSAASAWTSTAQEKVCIEETAGVCLKYRTVTPKAAPKRNAVRPSEPASPEASAEAAIRMTPEERRAVQRSLRELGLYKGGIDGAFGQGTRRAIARWQIDRGDDSSGYLTLDQFRDLKSPQRAIARQPEAATEARAAEAEPADTDPIAGESYRAEFPRQTIADHVVEVTIIDADTARLRLMIDRGDFDRSCEINVGGPFNCTLRQPPWDPRRVSGRLPEVLIDSSGTWTRAASITLW